MTDAPSFGASESRERFPRISSVRKELLANLFSKIRERAPNASGEQIDKAIALALEDKPLLKWLLEDGGLELLIKAILGLLALL